MLPRTLHHQRWAVGGPGNTLGHTAQQQIFLTVRALSANHNQVALPFTGKAYNCAGGSSSFHKGTYSHADLAYGERGQGPIGPNEMLTFRVELLGIE